jgi:hypothetical protein
VTPIDLDDALLHANLAIAQHSLGKGKHAIDSFKRES